MARAIQRITSLCKVASNGDFLQTKNVSKNQVAGLIAKHLRDENYKRPPPFPYKSKSYGYINTLFDKTSWRFDENTKLIVVEGPINSGKEQFAKDVAKHYDMLYVPNVNMDIIYKTRSGVDTRVLNSQLPLKQRTFDIHEFLANPKDERSAIMQMNLFKARIYQYIDTLLHILSTGQGVVMNRCMYTEFIFLETFTKFGYLPKTMKDVHYKIRNKMMTYLMRPHLFIYLDCSVDNVMENIKAKKDPVEVNSPVLRPEVLQMMENLYENYLKKITRHSEVLKVDVSKPIDYDVIFEKLDSLALDRGEFDFKMADWYFHAETWLNRRRAEFSAYRYKILNDMEKITYWDTPELWIELEDRSNYNVLLKTLPGGKYAPGYNDDVGDYTTFKTSSDFQLLTSHI